MADETTLTNEQIDENIAAVLAAFEAERALRSASPKTAKPKPRGRRSERRGPLSDATKLRLSEKLRKYNATQGDGEIFHARQAKQLTQAEAAKLAGIPISSYRDVEKGRSHDVVNIARVRHVLGLSL